jgi:two-component system nitrate/nitrite response regulator NarL
MEVLRLVLVDDYRMVTEALSSRLSTAPDLWVAGCCQTDDARLPEIIRWLRPDIVLIDVEPLGFAVAEVLSRIRTAWPKAHIIVVSADEDASHAVEAARAGADAWVPKSQGADELETVLRGVARGHSWFPPDMLGEVLRGLRDDVRDARESSNLLDTLSPRELDVLTSMAKGKRARQIAAELMISADTVRTHTRSIFGKLEVHSRIEAVSVAWAAGLRPAEPHAPPAAKPGPAQRSPEARQTGSGDQPAREAARQPGRQPGPPARQPDRKRPDPGGAGRTGTGRTGRTVRDSRDGRDGSGRDGSAQDGSARDGSGRDGAGRTEPTRALPTRPVARPPKPGGEASRQRLGSGRAADTRTSDARTADGSAAASSAAAGAAGSPAASGSAAGGLARDASRHGGGPSHSAPGGKAAANGASAESGAS